MTWTKEVTLWCEGDGCSRWVAYGESSVTETRKLARSDGWKAGTRGDKCPDCQEEEIAEALREARQDGADEARTVARSTHVVAKAVLSESWDDPHNQVPGRKCCEVTNAAWIGLDQMLRANEDHHDWLTDDEEGGEDE